MSAYVGTVGSRRDTVVKQADALQARVSSFQGEGATADALRDKMKRAHEALTTLADDLAEVQDAVSAAADNISDVESAVRTTLTNARLLQCSITDTGKAVFHPSARMEQGYKFIAEAAVNYEVSTTLALAEYADASFYARLDSAAKDENSASSASGKGTHAWSKADQEKFQN